MARCTAVGRTIDTTNAKFCWSVHCSRSCFTEHIRYTADSAIQQDLDAPRLVCSSYRNGTLTPRLFDCEARVAVTTSCRGPSPPSPIAFPLRVAHSQFDLGAKVQRTAIQLFYSSAGTGTRAHKNVNSAGVLMSADMSIRLAHTGTADTPRGLYFS